MQPTSPILRASALTLSLLLAAGAAQAQTTVDQAKAQAGGVTPGDWPGFPITIDKPGSYVLTGNLDVPFHMNAFVINADNVTLDLNGFEVRSSGVCTRDANNNGWVSCNSASASGQQLISFSGIDVNGSNTVIRNGTIAGFRGHGVYGPAGGLWLDGLRIRHNRHNGVQMMGSGNRVTDTDLQLNKENGILGVRVLVDGVTARENGDHGMQLSHSLVSRSMATHNRISGLHGSPSTDSPTSVRHSQFQANVGPAEVSGTIVSGGGNLSNASAF
ncbi:MAG: hypothetical protein H7Z19_20965 [Chitinophagaceae bacterium]|nr:hypothetical protein [Rubrivivax sp.]